MMFGREKRGDARRGQAIAVVTSLVAALLLVTFMTGCGEAQVDATAPSETPKAVQEGTAEDAARSTKVSPDLEACTLERVVDGDTIVVNLDVCDSHFRKREDGLATVSFDWYDDEDGAAFRCGRCDEQTIMLDGEPPFYCPRCGVGFTAYMCMGRSYPYRDDGTVDYGDGANR